MTDTTDAPADTATGDRRWTEYMRLPDIAAALRNPKQHAEHDINNSIRQFGLAELPTLDERTGRLVAGHGRLDQLTAMRAANNPPPRYVQVDDDGEWLVPVERGWESEDDDAAAAYLVASNNLTTKGGWDRDELGALLLDINAADHSLYLATGMTDDDLTALLDAANSTGGGDGGGGGGARLTDDDEIPEQPADPITQPGDLWQLGAHRIICGDTTDPATVARLFTAHGDGPHGLAALPPAVVIHADPPYGMGKEADGVQNDNLYGPKLDTFQGRWWQAWREHWAPNGSAYVWGNAPDLWRWWWAGGWNTDPDLMVRNEIVWDKETAPGMRSAGEHSYVTATERCLLVFRGEQFLGNQNKDAYWEGFEPLRLWVVEQRNAAGWTNKDINRLTKSHMAGHWTSRSQFHIIGRHHYATLAEAAAGKAFAEDYDALFDRLFPDLRQGGNAHRRDLSAEMRAKRTYFDNTHDVMTDVWSFGRVVGEDRFGHATPKPVAMVERAITTSTPPGTVVAVPFGGTGPEWIAADHLGRIAVGAEITPAYVDVICRRYQAHTGITPERVHPDGRRERVDFL
ncbi:DNA methyltransferase [Micromonospora sp. RP3T]|uniref:DNA methyltransferase n=1 Tax=Micromonospora sp. RP3T TaxID=2135446 RepID=UPI003D72288E